MRKHLVWVLGLGLAVAAASVAVAAQVQTMTGSASNPRLPKTTRVGVGLTISTHLSGSPLVAANRAQIKFDDEFAIFTRGLPTCAKAQIDGKSSAAAKAACGSAKIGGGNAAANVGGVNVPVKVLAFNGKPQGGKPVILLHSAPSIGSPVVLVGVLTDFKTTVRKSFRFRGHLHSYVSAKCGDANHKLNFQGKFNYADGSSQTATDTQTCTVRS